MSLHADQGTSASCVHWVLPTFDTASHLIFTCQCLAPSTGASCWLCHVHQVLPQCLVHHLYLCVGTEQVLSACEKVWMQEIWDVWRLTDYYSLPWEGDNTPYTHIYSMVSLVSDNRYPQASGTIIYKFTLHSSLPLSRKCMHTTCQPVVCLCKTFSNTSVTYICTKF